MELSLPAWLGGLVGTVIAVAIYMPGIRIIEARLRARNGPQTLEQRAAFEEKLSVARRLHPRDRRRGARHHRLFDRQRDVSIEILGGRRR